MARHSAPSPRVVARMVREFDEVYAGLRRGEHVMGIEVRTHDREPGQSGLVVVLAPEDGLDEVVRSLAAYGVRAGAPERGDVAGGAAAALVAAGWPPNVADEVARAAVGPDAGTSTVAGLVGRASWGVAWVGRSGAGALLVREP